MNISQYMKSYWKGYRACDACIYDFGIEYARKYAHVMNCSDAYYKGWLRRLAK